MFYYNRKVSTSLTLCAQLDVSWITDGSFKLANEIRKEKKEGGEGGKREEGREGKGRGDLEEEEGEKCTSPD